MPIEKRYRYDISGVIGSGCFINVVTGARSYGKTYGWKKRCIKNFIERGETWGYLRTFDQEIKDLLADGPDAFFSDITRNDEFPGYRFRTQGRMMQCGKVAGKDKKGEEIVRWKVMGQLLALTKAQSYKGKTVANMTWIVFDEFIRETRIPPYPPNCVRQLFSLWETIDRRENRTRIVMLANAADVVNPYFVAWGIVPPPVGGHCRVPLGDAFVYVENCWSKEFEEYADDSAIGRYTKGTAYAAYAQKNQFANQSGLFVVPKPKRCRCQYNIIWGEQTFGIWCDLDRLGVLWVGGAGAGAESMALMRVDAKPDVSVIARSDPYLKGLVNRGRRGLIEYESDRVRERFLQVLELCGYH